MILTNVYFEHYPLLQAEKTETTVVYKGIKKNDFLPHTYFVIVDHDMEKEHAIYEAKRHYVSKRQVVQLDSGDKFVGLTTDGQNFFTLLDIMHDSIVYTIVIIILLALIILLTYPFMEKIKWIGTPFIYIKEKLKKYTISHPRFPQYILGIGSIIIASFLLLYGLHQVHKLIPIAQTETEALIVEKNEDRVASPYLRMNYRYATIAYTVNDKTQYAIIDVPNRIYNEFREGEEIPITYRNSNTYDAFIVAPTMDKLIHIIFSTKMIIIVLMAIILFYFIKLFRKERRENNKTHK